MTHPPKPDDRYALYEHAHHDLWWARTQQWSVANWALLLVAGIAGVAKTLTPAGQLTLEHTWPYAVLVVLVAWWAGVYVRRLHDEIAHNREVYRELERQTGINELRATLPGQDRGTEATDSYRGITYVSVMVLAIAVASVFAIRLLVPTWLWAIPFGGLILLVNLTLVASGALKWQRRQQPCEFCRHKRLMHTEQGECFASPCTCSGFLAPP